LCHCGCRRRSRVGAGHEGAREEEYEDEEEEREGEGEGGSSKHGPTRPAEGDLVKPGPLLGRALGNAWYKRRMRAAAFVRAMKLLAVLLAVSACQATSPPPPPQPQTITVSPLSPVPPVSPLAVVKVDERRPDAAPASPGSGLASYVLDAIPADIPHPLDINFENKIHLVGFGIEPASARPGHSLKLTFYWRCDDPLADAGWQAFTHIADEGRSKVDNLDFAGPLRQMQDGHQALGPGRWEMGKFYVDEQTYTVPADVKGPLSVMVGIWKATARLLILSGPNDGDNRAIVTKVQVASSTDPPAVPVDVARPPAKAQRTASGLAYRVLIPGTGTEHPTPTSLVTVDYTGWTPDGKMFDSSVVRGQPANFRLSSVIKGWTEGVQLMTRGEKARFWIPGNLAYGDAPGRPGMPMGMLVFDVELLEIR
jgi:hypothetical protein